MRPNGCHFFQKEAPGFYTSPIIPGTLGPADKKTHFICKANKK
jgi:hypothetical protein